MKKTIAMLVLMLMLISMAACGQTPAENGESQTPGIQNGDQGQSGDDVVPTEPETTLPPEPVKQWYEDESVIMFAVKNQFENKKDRNTVYYYNYKGEELLAPTGGVPLVYAENDLALTYGGDSYFYGYVDREGSFVLDPQYMDASCFSPDGLAVVAKKKQDDVGYAYGMIDSEGKEVVPCIYGELSLFNSYGYAVIGESALDPSGSSRTVYGIIDRTGQVVVEPIYWAMAWIGDGCFMAKPTIGEDTNSYRIYDIAGNELYTFMRPSKTCRKSYLVDNERLWRIREEIEDKDNTETVRVSWSYFDGKEFVKEPSKTDYEIHIKKEVSNQVSYAHGIMVNGELVIPIEYDYIYEENSYFYCTKAEGSQQYSLDIYDENFQKIIQGIPYGKFVSNPSTYDTKFVSLGYGYRKCHIPEGYFVVNARIDHHVVQGVVDIDGNVIVDVIYEGVPFAVCYENRKFIHRCHEDRYNIF